MNKELHDLVFHTDRKALPQYNRPAPTNSKSIGPTSKQVGAIRSNQAKPMIAQSGMNNFRNTPKALMDGADEYPDRYGNDEQDRFRQEEEDYMQEMRHS